MDTNTRYFLLSKAFKLKQSFKYLARLPMPRLPCVLQSDVDAVCVVSAGAVFNTIIEMFPNMRVSVYIVCIVYIVPTVHLTQQSINMSMQVSPVTTTSIASSYSQGKKSRHISALSCSKLLRTGRADCNFPCCTLLYS